MVWLLAWPTLAGVRDAQWSKVDAAVSQGLPKSAIEALLPIIDGALKDKAYPEAAKAIARRIMLEGAIEGNKPEEMITRLQTEITKAPRELVPVFETILADWYWGYFQQNQWRFMRRTATAEAPGNDFTTWDLPRLFAEIDRHFRTALGAAETLRKIPIASFNDLLPKGTLPDKYRPTLYDFIAQEALQFYSSGEQAAAKPEDAFEVATESPILGPLDSFLGWRLDTADTNSPVVRAIQLYQEVLKFHRADADPSALIDADLARLKYGKNIAVGEDANARYKAAMKGMAEKWGDHELAAQALAEWATVLNEEGDFVQARAVAQRGTQVRNGGAGSVICRNLIIGIEARALSISTERVWNQSAPKISVEYRNLTRVYFRAVPYDWSVFLQRNHSRPEDLNDEEKKDLLAKAPALAWTADLPATVDFRTRTVESPAPLTLKPGFYFILASPDPSFTDTTHPVSYVDVWVSELALVIRPRNGRLEGFVLEAGSGEPVPATKLEAWHLDRNGNRVAETPVNTDGDGFFSFAAVENGNYVLRATQGTRQLGSIDIGTYDRNRRAPAEEQTIFFTDRAIYRPGQTIQYKGICLRVAPETDNYVTLKGRDVTVVFNDPNGKEIARQTRQANDFGSFAGSFTAPRDRLAGRMTLQITRGPAGNAGFSVEEYKRPKFQTTIDAPKAGGKLRDKITVTGHALAYTGAAVDGAKVSYHVRRETRYPAWRGFYSWWPRPTQGEQEIAHGTAATAADGSFSITFVAQPDAAVPEKDEPVFEFHVTADVTDSAGETRSGETHVRIGYTALQAGLSVEDWQTATQAVTVRITTTTLDGEGQLAEGAVKIYRLQEPAVVPRAALPPQQSGYGYRGWNGFRPGNPVTTAEAGQPDAADPNTWPLGPLVAEQGITTDAKGERTVTFKLPVGIYRATFATRDRFGKPVTALAPLKVLDPAAEKLAIKLPSLLAAPAWSLEPGQDFTALWGTGYDTGRAFVELEHRHKIIQHFWTRPGTTQAAIRQAVTAAMRGGFTLHVTQVRENRAYLESRRVEVPWSNKELDLRWEHFSSRLDPGQKDTWTAIVTGPNASRAVAEMVATLYDASLDTFSPLNWPHGFGFFRSDYSTAQPRFENAGESFRFLQGQWTVENLAAPEATYRTLPPELRLQMFNVYARYGRRMAKGGAEPMVMMNMAPAPMVSAAAPMAGHSVDSFNAPSAAKAMPVKEALMLSGVADKMPGSPPSPTTPPAPNLNEVAARKNLNESAFFFPQLLTDTNGAVRMSFTMPEALTRWRFLGFAHDRELRSGLLEGEVVTAKDLMVQPNPPRFVREGDTLEFTVKVSNQSTNRQTGKVRLTFNEAATGQSADQRLGNTRPELNLDLPAKASQSYSWRIKVPDGLPFLSYKAVAAGGRFTDGEEGTLPVLSRMVLVTESLPLPIRGPGTKKFSFTKLLSSGKSADIRSQSLTVQMVSNPAWYAVMALPYLMEFPHECAEQTFNRFYANALARSIALSDPKIRRVFDLWKNTSALVSPLEKNQDLKSVMIEETPWYRDARGETEARQNVGLLFDENRLNQETTGTLRKLTDLQLGDGAWPWFPGGRGDDYITLYITTGFGRLRHLGVDVDTSAALRSLDRLDGWVDQMYRQILKDGHPDENHLNQTVALYLYGRSFFLKDRPIPAAARPAVDYFLGQAKKYWVPLADRQSQGHLALALLRFGDATTPAAIVKSLKERSVTNEEMGRFWRDTESSWWWYRAPIETQALMIEVFAEVARDAATVEDCKVWLLKQKQTQNWPTTKSTADAIYALLLHGTNVLTSDALVQVTLGGQAIKPVKTEAGTGFYEQRFTGPEIKSAQGAIVVTKSDAGVAWGGVHWQYLEDVGKVTPHTGTPLTLKKSLFVKRHTGKGAVLEAVRGPLAVGDELVVRLELRTDRAMEYVHLKDQRGSGLEPLNVISQYHYQDGLAYYESTRDTASHFFINYLPKGTYVFEYGARVVHRGEYQSGLAEIQCMYAPEFNSHSESLDLRVR